MLAIVVAGAMTMGLAMPTSVFAAGGTRQPRQQKPTSVKPLIQRLERTRHLLFKLQRLQVMLRRLLFRILHLQTLKQEVKQKELKFYFQQIGQMLANTNIQ